MQAQAKLAEDALAMTVAEVAAIAPQHVQVAAEVEQAGKTIIESETKLAELKKSLETKTAELAAKEKSAADAAAAGQTPPPEDLSPLKAELDGIKKMVAEMEGTTTAQKTVREEKAKLAMNLENKLKELDAKKVIQEKQKADLAVALPPAVEAANAAKLKMDAANVALAAANAKFESAKADLVRFEQFKASIMTKDAEMKTKLAGFQEQMQGAQAAAMAEKSNLDTMVAAIAKLQEQLTQLQQQMAAEDAKRQTAEQSYNGKAQAVAALAAEIEKLQSEISVIEENRKVFQAAYGGN
jgi:chromosome segregation ATPase